MITLNKYIEQLQELQNKGWGELPVIFASDDEGNSYHKVYIEPSEFLVEDLEKRELEPAFEYEENGKEVKDFVPNCIIIN